MKPSMSPHSSSRPPRRPGTAGFTLLEVLVAIAILATVLTAIYGVFSSIVAAKTRLDTDSDAFHRARVIYDRLGRELRGVATAGPAGHKGVFRGGRDGDGNPYLEMTTTAAAQRGGEFTGIVQVRYSLDQDREQPRGGKILLRREQSGLRHDAADIAPMRLAPGIERMLLRYHGNGTWYDEWDADTRGLPAMIELSLEMTDARGERRYFTSTLELPDIDWNGSGRGPS